ncbi:Cytochrome oxidase biogenesis protein Sco1/SenC/PrrC, putative copper metallochaperone [Rhodovulum sp. P5]|uniref:SCO family protein n=1 Tax=Rhodovulum sp. P5 TaxID=1564506 RepID=UPI0009C2227D|nr:SCO family protein [Rhodovulum sp. P5]ARE40581.1 Cytochrome oxidase biogenesis protein Sco1/SenC/PrrC, putative copper metallochaperone [Rhodovulum sp. P5]
MSRIALVSYAAFAVFATAVIGSGVYLWQNSRQDDRFAACRDGGLAGPIDEIGGPFTLVDETGATVTDADVIDGPTLLYFGYTFCPDVCPLDNTRNAQAIFLLDDRGYQVKPVFISVDAGRDTPELLAEFTEYMHPRMLGLTGTADQVKVASRAYRTFYQIQDPDEEYYLIDHSTFSYLAFPETGVVEVFKRDLTPEEMADRIACFVDSLEAN